MAHAELHLLSEAESLDAAVARAARRGHVVEATVTGADGMPRTHKLKVHSPPRRVRIPDGRGGHIDEQRWRCVSQDDGTEHDLLAGEIEAG